jgi:hypothetical protein
MQSYINRYTLYSFLFLVGIFLLVKYAAKRSRINISKECTLESKRQIKGVVSNFYFDNDINVKAFVILFTSGEKYINPVFLKGLNGHISEGDSIYKASGIFRFEIYQKGNSKPFILEDTVDCTKF